MKSSTRLAGTTRLRIQFNAAAAVAADDCGAALRLISGATRARVRSLASVALYTHTNTLRTCTYVCSHKHTHTHTERYCTGADDAHEARARALDVIRGSGGGGVVLVAAAVVVAPAAAARRCNRAMKTRVRRARACVCVVGISDDNVVDDDDEAAFVSSDFGRTKRKCRQPTAAQTKLTGLSTPPCWLRPPSPTRNRSVSDNRRRRGARVPTNVRGSRAFIDGADEQAAVPNRPTEPVGPRWCWRAERDELSRAAELAVILGALGVCVCACGATLVGGTDGAVFLFVH